MSRLERVLNVHDATAEQRLAAGMIAAAVQEARLGDPEALLWLELCALPWLSYIVPNTVDPETIHRALLVQAAPQRPWQTKLMLEEEAA